MFAIERSFNTNPDPASRSTNCDVNVITVLLAMLLLPSLLIYLCCCCVPAWHSKGSPRTLTHKRHQFATKHSVKNIGPADYGHHSSKWCICLITPACSESCLFRATGQFPPLLILWLQLCSQCSLIQQKCSFVFSCSMTVWLSMSLTWSNSWRIMNRQKAKVAQFAWKKSVRALSTKNTPIHIAIWNVFSSQKPVSLNSIFFPVGWKCEQILRSLQKCQIHVR